jgi:hypothetical protein
MSHRLRLRLIVCQRGTKQQYSNTSNNVAIFISHLHSAVPSAFCSHSKRRDCIIQPLPSSPWPVHGFLNSTIQKYQWFRNSPAHGFNSLANLTNRYLLIPFATLLTFRGSTTLPPHATILTFPSSMFCEPLIARVPGVSDVACLGLIHISLTLTLTAQVHIAIAPHIYLPTDPFAELKSANG